MSTIDKNLTKGHFDSIASNYGVNDHGGNVDKSDVFLSVLPEAGQAVNVLECGGGGGLYTRMLLQRGFHVTTVDLSPKALEVNKSVADSLGLEERLTTVEGSFNEVFKHDSESRFDLILFVKVLHHFDDLPEIHEAMRIAARLLSENGRLVIFEPNGRNPLWRPFLSLQKDKVTGRPKWDFEKNLQLTTVKNLAPVIRAQGMNTKVTFHYVIPGFLTVGNGGVKKVMRSINGLLEKTPFSRWAFNFMIQAEKQN